MFNEIQNGPVLQKLSDLLADKYGVSVRLLRLFDSSCFGDSQYECIEQGNNLLIPIKVNNILLSAAVIDNANHLDAKDRQTATQLVRMMMDPIFYSHYLSSKITNEVDTNSPSFFEYPQTLFNGTLADINKPLERPKRSLCIGTIFSRSPNQLLFNRFSHSVHEVSERWAMLRIQDISSDISSANDLIDMGPITITVEELGDIDPKLVKAICEYVSQPHTPESPMLLVNSKLSLIELNAKLSLGDSVMEYFLFNQIDLSAMPMTEDKIKEIIDMLFYD
jgi:hypothetical protein